jgi:hypothetical protein
VGIGKDVHWIRCRAISVICAVIALIACISSTASAASIYRGCDAPQWGTSLCWDSANPADVAAMHPCSDWTNRHTRAFNQDEGSYQGFVKIRSTVSCKLAYKLINDRTEGGPEPFYPAEGWYWYSGYGNVGGTWYRGAEALFRGLHIARTNEPVQPSGTRNKPATMLEHDLITYDQEELVDCNTPLNKADEHCVNVTPASYAGVRL